MLPENPQLDVVLLVQHAPDVLLEVLGARGGGSAAARSEGEAQGGLGQHQQGGKYLPAGPTGLLHEGSSPYRPSPRPTGLLHQGSFLPTEPPQAHLECCMKVPPPTAPPPGPPGTAARRSLAPGTAPATAAAESLRVSCCLLLAGQKDRRSLALYPGPPAPVSCPWNWVRSLGLN
nr:forkhead box protein D2-like [Macaca nemestrina]